ncbi:MAG: anthranilate phosphoribosyltransferase, partial [Acidobacteriota bacterium]
PRGVVVDTCGTGGDGLRTFNISTATAFVVAGAGVPVAKHGNRSVSSQCGSADVVEALGIPLLRDPSQLSRCLRDHRLAFLFAPFLHPAMHHAAAARRALRVRTVFNLVGPLANPAGVEHQLVGVPDPALGPILARVLGRLGSRVAWVVSGEGGMDELTTTGSNHVAVWKDGLHQFDIDPRDYGLPRASLTDLEGGTVEENAERICEVLAGGKGPDRDVVLLNAAATLVVAGLADDLSTGLRRAAESLSSGSARGVLNRLRSFPAGGDNGERRHG